MSIVVMGMAALVFCCQNCFDLLWEKIVLVIEKNFRFFLKNQMKFGSQVKSKSCFDAC